MTPYKHNPSFYTSLEHACDRIKFLHKQDPTRRFKVRRSSNGLWQMYICSEVM